MDRRSELKLAYKQTPRPMGVYQIRNIVNDKVFVGSNTNLDGIFNRHVFQLKHGSHPRKDLQRDWKELGEDKFAFEVLEILEPSEEYQDVAYDLKKMEEKWLEKLQPYGEKGYN